MKAVIKIHRLLGFVLCLLFVIWCLSGFVMMYKGFPSVTVEDKMKIASFVDFHNLEYPKNLEEFIDLDSISSLKIQAINSEPVFTIETNSETIFNISADSSSKKITYSEIEAKEIIKNYYSNGVKFKEVELISELDQWIPRTHFLSHMPIHRISIDNDQKTVWYISSKTGEVLQKLSYSDKVWAWLGAIPHWIYFKEIRINTPLWRFIVITLSFLGVLLSIGGIVLGINRFRIARKRKQFLTPYKKKWFKWHHYLGFIFGLFTFTWILSGLFSMNPLKWSPEDSLTQKQQYIWQGKNTLKKGFKEENLNKLIKHFDGNKAIVTIEFKCFDKKIYAIVKNVFGKGSTYLFDQKYKDKKRLKLAVYKAKIKQLFPKSSITSCQILNEYDDYYYSRKNQLPLPIYKYVLDDNAQTAIYIDPNNHQVLKKVEQKNRLERWVYNGLHSLDFASLRNKRPLWDIVVIVLLVGVTLLSITGAVLTYKKLFRKK
jgi:uncharacterized membrane protein HdeD (DUF308 family)